MTGRQVSQYHLSLKKKVINKVFSKLFQFLIMFALATMIYIIRHHFTKKKKEDKRAHRRTKNTRPYIIFGGIKG